MWQEFKGKTNILYVFGGERAQGAEIVIERLIAHNYAHVNAHLLLSPGDFANELLTDVKSYKITTLEALKKLNRSGTGKIAYLLNAIGKYFKVSRAVLNYAKKHDIELIHANTIAPATYLLPAILYAKLFRSHLRWCWSDHDMKYFSPLEIRLSNICVQMYHRTLVVSQAVSRKYSGNPKVTILYNGLDTSRFKPNDMGRERFRSEFGFQSDALVIGIVASINPDKGQRELIQAFRGLAERNPRLQLLLAGNYAAQFPEYAIEIKKLIDATDNVRHCGYLADVIDLYNGCDLIVNNSSGHRSEALGTSIYEAMACEKLVIATDTGGTPEIISDKKDGLMVKLDDVTDLTRELEKACNTYDSLEYVRKAARQKVLVQFNIDTMVNNYNEIIAAMMSNKRKTQSQLDSFLLCISLLILSLGSYIVWPSRYNALQHLSVGGCFVSVVVPAAILQIHHQYPDDIVSLYINLLVVGAVAYVLGLLLGYVNGDNIKTHFSYEVMDSQTYEARVIKISRNLLIAGIVGMVVSYAVMGFMPIFAADPISAKLFRGQYQAPYSRVSIIFRTAFFILSTIMPIACIIWYKTRSRFFFFAIVAALLLMTASLARSGAFTGIVIAFAIIMSFKSRLHFFILMTVLIGVYVLSSYFYYLVGIRSYSDDTSIWQIITAGTPDIPDQLDFLTRFIEHNEWTYGRTMYGGLIPGHYKWNPAVYTLVMVNPGMDINDIGSGGLRLPLPMWGYVSFGWSGVVGFSFFTGLISGAFVKMLQGLFKRFESIVIRTIGFIALGSVVGIFAGFATLSIYTLPPAFVCLFYLYRIKLK